MLVLKGLVGLHRTVELLQHYWLGCRLGLLWYWMVCLGNKQSLFCHFWDCIQVLHFGLFCWLWWNHNHRKLVNLITRTPVLSNSVKLSHAMWGHPRRAGHGGEVWQNVVHWRREWQTTSVFLPWEPPWTVWKGKMIGYWKGNSQLGRCPICYWRSVEK